MKGYYFHYHDQFIYEQLLITYYVRHEHNFLLIITAVFRKKKICCASRCCVMSTIEREADFLEIRLRPRILCQNCVTLREEGPAN